MTSRMSELVDRLAEQDEWFARMVTSPQFLYLLQSHASREGNSVVPNLLIWRSAIRAVVGMKRASPEFQTDFDDGSGLCTIEWSYLPMHWLPLQLSDEVIDDVGSIFGNPDHAVTGRPEDYWGSYLGRENLLQRSRSRGEAVLHQLGELGVHWQFWRKWYDGFLQGTPIDWDLQRRVARIPDDEWERGIEHVSKYIDDLEKGIERPERLPETPVRAQAQKLIQAALVFETSARGLQNLIHMAVDAYRREVSNALPEELQPLEQLPPTLEQIALILAGTPTSPGSEAELYHLLQSMAATISALNLRLKQSNLKVSDLENRLSDRSGRCLFASAFYTKSGEGMAGLMTSKILWGGVISGVGFVLGPSGDALLEALDHCYKEIIIPEMPAYDLSRLPPSTEV